MPIGAQPRGRRGTVEEPYTPLNLRLILAAFGVVVCAGVSFLLFRAGLTVPGWLLAAWAVVALGDVVVVQLRRRARGKADHSIFE
jgi:hypothetical protein